MITYYIHEKARRLICTECWIFPRICIPAALTMLLLTACPMLTTMETAKVGTKPEDKNPFIVGDAKQVDLCATVVSELEDTAGPIRIRSTVPLIEGKLTWILISERVDLTLNCGTSGLGLSSKLQIIRRPLYLAVKAGLTGFPTVIRMFPRGCYTLDLLASHDIGTNSEIYGGCKFVSWFDIPPAVLVLQGYVEPIYPVDPYFDAVGGFIGIKFGKLTIEAGLFEVFNELENYWGKDGYIPSIGIGFPVSG